MHIAAEGGLMSLATLESMLAFGRLELEWCETKTLLSGWRLEVSAGAM